MEEKSSKVKTKKRISGIENSVLHGINELEELVICNCSLAKRWTDFIDSLKSLKKVRKIVLVGNFKKSVRKRITRLQRNVFPFLKFSFNNLRSHSK